MKRNPENIGLTVPVIDENKSSVDYFGERYVYDDLKNDSIFMEFQKKIKELKELYNTVSQGTGDCLLHINKNYGYTWRTIPWGKFDEIREWILHTWFRFTEMINPDMHYKLMAYENDYSKAFRICEEFVKNTPIITLEMWLRIFKIHSPFQPGYYQGETTPELKNV